MKTTVGLLLITGLCGSINAQVMEDEMLQARMHYMNNAKVSYMASAEVTSFISEEFKESMQDVPADVEASFFNKYHEAKQVQWIVTEDRYKINFVNQGKNMFAYLDRHGTWIKSFTKLPNEQLPELIAEYLRANYSNYQLIKYYLKDTPQGTSYTLAVKKEGIYIWLEFDDQGNILSNQA